MTIGTVPVNSRYLHTGSEISKIHTMRNGCGLGTCQQAKCYKGFSHPGNDFTKLPKLHYFCDQTSLQVTFKS